MVGWLIADVVFAIAVVVVVVTVGAALIRDMLLLLPNGKFFN